MRRLVLIVLILATADTCGVMRGSKRPESLLPSPGRSPSERFHSRIERHCLFYQHSASKHSRPVPRFVSLRGGVHLSRDDENDALDRSSEAEAEGRVPRTWDELSGKEQRVRGLRLRNAAEQGLVIAQPFPSALIKRIRLDNEIVPLD